MPGNVSSTAWTSSLQKSVIKNDGCQSGFQSLMTCKASLMESVDSSWRTKFVLQDELMMPQTDSRYTDVLIIQVLSVAGIAYNIILKFCIINATIFTEEKFVIGGLHLPLLDFFLCICLIAV